MKRIVSLLLITLLVLHAGLLNAGLAHAQTGEELVKIDSLQVSPSKVNGGEKVTFNLKTRNENVKDIILSYINEEQQKKEINLQQTNDGWNGEYQTAVEDTGKWSLSTITAANENGNKTILPASALADQSAVNFEVAKAEVHVQEAQVKTAESIINLESDEDLPKVTSVDFGKDSILAGEGNSLSLQISNYTNVQYIDVQLISPSGRNYQQVDFMNFESELVTEEFYLPDNIEPGEWRVYSIYIYKKNGESEPYYYYPDNYPSTFKTFNVVNELFDEVPPTVTKVELSKETVNAGETVDVYVTASDNSSGIRGLDLSVTDYKGQYLQGNYFEKLEDGRWKTTVTIPETIKSSTWYVCTIFAYDFYSNELGLYYDTPSENPFPTFNVVNDNLDSEPPVVKSASFEKTTIQPGENNTLSMVVEDASSVETVRVDVSSPSRNYTHSFDAAFEGGQWKADIVLPNPSEPGEWKIERIYVKDTAGNYKNYYYPYYDYPDYLDTFTIINENYDADPPTFVSLNFEKDTIQAGESNTVQMNAEDPSGIQYAAVGIISSTNKNTRYIELDPKELSTSFTIPASIEPGEWRVNYITLWDTNYNQIDISFEHENYPENLDTFHVVNENYDNVPPEVSAIEFNKSVVNAGETLEVYVTAEDKGVGISNLALELSNDDVRLFIHGFEEQLDGRWKALVEIPNYYKNDEWYVSYVTVNDNNNNEYSQTYSKVLNPYPIFTVYNEHPDLTPPSLSEIYFEKNEMEPYEQNTMYVRMEDDLSGVKNASILLTSPSGKHSHHVFVREEVSEGLYSGTFEMDEYAEGGEWRISEVELRDNNGNTLINNYSNENYPSFFGTIQLNNDKADVEAPVVSDIQFSKDAIQAGEAVEVFMTATDNQSGISYISLELENDEGSIRGIYNFVNQDGKWVGKWETSAYMKPGKYKVRSFYITDKAGNELNKYYGPYGEALPEHFGTLIVENEHPDVSAPEIKSITFMEPGAEAGKTIYAKIEAVDDLSEVIYASATLKSPSGQRLYPDSTEKQSDGSWMAAYTLSTYAEPGEWKVRNVRTEDAEGNYFSFYVDDQAQYPENFGTFTVTNEHPDVTAPVFKSIAFDKESYKAGDEIHVTAVIEDDLSGVDFGEIGLTSPEGDEWASVYLSKADGNLYTGKVQLPSNAAPGEWKVIHSYVRDLAFNIASVDYFETYPDTFGKFSVINDFYVQKPIVYPIGSTSTELSGESEPGYNIQVFDWSNNLLATGTADEEGQFSITIPVQKAGTELKVTAANAEGITSAPRYVYVEEWSRPNTPVLNSFTNQDTVLTGTADPFTNVFIYIGDQTYFASVNETGDFSVEIGKQASGTVVEAVAEDSEGKTSFVAKTIVQEVIVPEKPVVNEVDDNDFVVTGTAQARTIIQVRAGSSVLGTATTTDLGVFSVEIEKQNAGTILSVIAIDTAGYESEAVEVSVADKTAPGKPDVNPVDDNDLKVTGTAEAKSLVTVKAGTTTLGTAITSENGVFSVEVAMQKAGVKLSVTALDVSNNESEETEVTVIDKTAPGKPVVNAVDDNDAIVTGKAEAGSKVTIKTGTTTLGTASASDTGNFSVNIAKQAAGVKLTIMAEDAAGNIGEAIEVAVVDKTAPTAPTVNTVDDNDLKVTGKAEAGSTVTVKAGTTALGTATATSTGTFSVTIVKQKAGTKLTVTATDSAMNTSEAATVTVVDKTAPSAPTVNAVDDNDLTVTGKAEAGSTVTVKVGTTTLGTTTATSPGTFSVTIAKQKAGTKLTVTATDTAMNTSEAATVTVVDKTAPSAPTVNAVDDNDLTVTGKAEAGSTVTVKAGATTLGTATATSPGTFSVTIAKQKAGTKLTVTATDTAKNISTATSVTVIDKTAPAAPTVNAVDDNDLKVTGKAEAGSSVTVKAGTTTLGTATATSTGTFSVTIVKQKAGTKLTVTATDKAKNTSTAKTLTVIDKTAPNAPTINRVDSNDLKITGKGEVGSTIIVKVGTKTIGSGKVLSNGTYSIKIAAQKTGTKLTVTATDLAKNVSKGTVITVVKV